MVPPCLGHIFVTTLRINYGLDKLVINYLRIGDCFGHSVGSSILWATENMVYGAMKGLRYLLIIWVRGYNLNAMMKK